VFATGITVGEFFAGIVLDGDDDDDDVDSYITSEVMEGVCDGGCKVVSEITGS
jgi:hypothetical protein